MSRCSRCGARSANIVMERVYGPGGEEKRPGTKHFPPGAKIYVLSFFWGMGGEQVTVVGRHRGSHRYVTMTIASKWLTNWRAEQVYSPYLIKKIQKSWGYDRSDPGGEAARLKAEQVAAMWNEAGAKPQPFLDTASSARLRETRPGMTMAFAGE